VLFAGNFLFSLYCGAVMHYQALDIGRIFLVAGLIQIVLMPIIGRVLPRIDPRNMLYFGVAGVCLSLWMNAHLTDQADFWVLTWPQFVRAVALGFIFIPVSVASLSDIPDHQRGNATGLFNLTRELGGSIGTAWMGLLIDRGSKINGAHLREAIYPSNPWYQEAYGAIAGSLAQQTYTRDLVPEAVLQLRVRLQALILAFNDGFAWAMLVFLASFVLVALLKKPRPGGAPAAGAH
jgi:DHA2 family multidrug resistance protein